MGWKRTTSKEQLKQEDLEQYFTELLPELNLRLLLEAGPETFFASASGVLWVENITVTAWKSPPVNFFRPAGRIKKYLMRLREILHP